MLVAGDICATLRVLGDWFNTDAAAVERTKGGVERGLGFKVKTVASLATRGDSDDATPRGDAFDADNATPEWRMEAWRKEAETLGAIADGARGDTLLAASIGEDTLKALRELGDGFNADAALAER